jgi:hypothetical protein
MAKGASSLDQALDELYAASPAEFTGKRDALAKQLKAAGDAAASAEVKAQRKPTQIAYVLNQLARKHADDLADLVDVGRELARAQRKALRGEAGADLRDAITRQRSVVRALTEKTAALMGTLGVPATGHLDEIAGALQAALVDPAVGAKLEEGRLDKVPEPAAGFPGASAAVLEVVPAPPERAKPKAHAKPHAKAERMHAIAAAHEEKKIAKARAAEEAKERAEAERREKLRAAASAASTEATERARIADEAEREADGRAAQAKKLADEARALDAEAKRLAAEAKRVAREAAAAARAAERANADATRASKEAKSARTAAAHADKEARAAAARA